MDITPTLRKGDKMKDLTFSEEDIKIFAQTLRDIFDSIEKPANWISENFGNYKNWLDSEVEP